jgi:hypothetical protein
MMFFYVQLWRTVQEKHPSVQQRVQAPSEGHAIVQVMRKQHLTEVYRAWASRSAKEPPTVRLLHVLVKGKTRRWQQEPEGGSSWERLQNAAQEVGYCLHRDLFGITLEHADGPPLSVSWRELDCEALTRFLYLQEKQLKKPFLLVEPLS